MKGRKKEKEREVVILNVRVFFSSLLNNDNDEEKLGASFLSVNK